MVQAAKFISRIIIIIIILSVVIFVLVRSKESPHPDEKSTCPRPAAWIPVYVRACFDPLFSTSPSSRYLPRPPAVGGDAPPSPLLEKRERRSLFFPLRTYTYISPPLPPASAAVAASTAAREPPYVCKEKGEKERGILLHPRA